MPLSTYEEIKKQVTDEMEQLKERTYPEDLLNEFADSETPIYYSEIIKEWVELPSEYCDRWKELGFDTQRNDGGITTLMQLDLFFYYQEQFQRAWEELRGEE